MLLLLVVGVAPLGPGAQVLDLAERVLAERLFPAGDWLLEQTDRKLEEVLLFSFVEEESRAPFG